MKVDNNIFVRGMTGKVGDQFVVRKGKGGQTSLPTNPNLPLLLKPPSSAAGTPPRA